MNMSFLRPTTRSRPASSRFPRSPVCSQPSTSIASAVARGIVEVSLHDAVAADQHLAVVGDAHLNALAGQARSRGHVLEGIPGPGQRHVAGLGEAVAGHQRLERQFAMNAADQFDGDVGGPGHACAQRRQLRFIADRQQRMIQRRRAGQHRDAFALNEIHHRVDIEHRHRQHRRAAQKRSDESRLSTRTCGSTD